MTQDIREQAAKYQEQARASGLSGAMYILACPEEGWLRLQLRDVPAPLMKQLVEAFQQTLAMGGQALNLQVKTKIRAGGENG